MTCYNSSYTASVTKSVTVNVTPAANSGETVTINLKDNKGNLITSATPTGNTAFKVGTTVYSASGFSGGTSNTSADYVSSGSANTFISSYPSIAGYAYSSTSPSSCTLYSGGKCEFNITYKSNPAGPCTPTYTCTSADCSDNCGKIVKGICMQNNCDGTQKTVPIEKCSKSSGDVCSTRCPDCDNDNEGKWIETTP